MSVGEIAATPNRYWREALGLGLSTTDHEGLHVGVGLGVSTGTAGTAGASCEFVGQGDCRACAHTVAGWAVSMASAASTGSTRSTQMVILASALTASTPVRALAH